MRFRTIDTLRSTSRRVFGADMEDSEESESFGFRGLERLGQRLRGRMVAISGLGVDGNACVTDHVVCLLVPHRLFAFFVHRPLTSPFHSRLRIPNNNNISFTHPLTLDHR